MKIFINYIAKRLIFCSSRRSGVNFFGRKTVYTKSGGYKYKRFVIDRFRNINNRYVLLSIVKQVGISAFLGLIYYFNGIFSFIVLNDGMKINEVYFGFNRNLVLNSSNFLFFFPTGTFVNNVETISGKGAKLSRSAGTSCFLYSKIKNKVVLKMNSGWLIKLGGYCIGVNGFVSNPNHNVIRVKNAGKKRKLGYKPRVRGVAMNPCDHAHGGGEGRSSPPVAHKTPYGKLTKVPTIRTLIHKRKKKNFKIF